MKQVFNVKGTAKVKEVPVPQCEAGEILVENIYSAVSTGTELKSITPEKTTLLKKVLKRKDLLDFAIKKAKNEGIFKTYRFGKSMFTNWWPLGYSCVGKIICIGKDVSSLKVGDIVACSGLGFANHAEYVVVPKNFVVKIPKKVDPRNAAFATIGAIAIHALHRAEVSFGQTIVVYGMGLIGNIVARILDAAGCQIIGVDINQK